MTTFTSEDLNSALRRWREDLLDELVQLRALGIPVPDRAFDLAKLALPADYQEMDNTDVCDLLIMLGNQPQGAANE